MFRVGRNATDAVLFNLNSILSYLDNTAPFDHTTMLPLIMKVRPSIPVKMQELNERLAVLFSQQLHETKRGNAMR